MTVSFDWPSAIAEWRANPQNIRWLQLAHEAINNAAKPAVPPYFWLGAEAEGL